MSNHGRVEKLKVKQCRCLPNTEREQNTEKLNNADMTWYAAFISVNWWLVRVQNNLFSRPPAWCYIGSPLATYSHEPYQACSLPQYTRHLLHTPGIVEVRNSRRQAADKSYIFCVSLGGSGGGNGHNLCACVGICLHVCVCSGMFFPASECVR